MENMAETVGAVAAEIATVTALINIILTIVHARENRKAHNGITSRIDTLDGKVHVLTDLFKAVIK